MTQNPETRRKAEIIIQTNRCDGCGLCVDFCPVGVLRLRDAIAVVVKPEACYACRSCEDLCPHGAIEVNEG